MTHNHDDAARLQALIRALAQVGYTLTVVDDPDPDEDPYAVTRSFGSLDDLWNWAEGNSDFGVIARPSGFRGEREGRRTRTPRRIPGARVRAGSRRARPAG